MPATPLIASRTNPRVKQLRAAFAGHARLSGDLIAIEGEHLLEEAIRAGLALDSIFLSQRATAPSWLPGAVERIELTPEVFASAVDTQTPQGIAALLAPPAWTLDDAFSPRRTPLLLIAAGLQDPGNLGTLIRSAEAFAATAVLTTPGTVSPWNQKAIRASAGSVFRMPVIPIALGAPGLAFETWVERRGIHLFAAVPAHAAEQPRPRVLPLTSVDLTQPCALLIGNEGAGLAPELLALAHTRITIPTPGPIESLNAAIAGSLLLYEAARQRTTPHAAPSTLRPAS